MDCNSYTLVYETVNIKHNMEYNQGARLIVILAQVMYHITGGKPQ